MIICGDNSKIMAGLPDNSVDLIVTDPPYGWKFMGRDWDKAVPSVAVWRECLRVLKPGAFAFVMSGPRMDCLSEMGKRLGEAGFEIGFSPIFWTYASGFNKSGNMSMLIDKRACRNELKAKLGRSPTKEEMKEAWAKFREAVGKGQYANRGRVTNEHSVSLGASEGSVITLPATPEAQALDGSYAGMQLKPATEIVIVAMKPLAHNTYIDQALDNAKGITWLDEARIPLGQSDDIHAKNPHTLAKGSAAYDGTCYGEYQGSRYVVPSGRFPANLLVSDDVLNDGRVTKANPQPRKRGTPAHDGRWQTGIREQPMHNDSGSFSRYFSLDSWADEHLPDLPESVQRTFPFLIVPKAGKREKEMGLDDCEAKPRHQKHYAQAEQSGRQFIAPDGTVHSHGVSGPQRNHHPTVKPLKLMSYLITLGSRPGDLVLDLFAGTCTTGMAAKLLGRRWLMIEIGEEWCHIGRRRVEAVVPKLL